MRPSVRFLTDDLIKQIIDEAVNILCNLGMKIRNKQLLSLLADQMRSHKGAHGGIKYTFNFARQLTAI